MEYDIKVYLKDGDTLSFSKSNWEYTDRHIIIFTDVSKYIFSQDYIIKLEVK